MEQIRGVLEIYLITGGMSILVLKSKKAAPLTTISKYFQKEWGFTFTKIRTQVLFKKKIIIKKNWDH